MSERLGVVVVLKNKDGDVLLLPQMDENVGKKEMVPGFHVAYLPVEGPEFPAGAVEERDKESNSPVDFLVLAAMRELAEESGIVGAPDQFAQMSNSMRVMQIRNNKEVDFSVALFELTLTSEQEKWLINYAGAIAANTIDDKDVRPRDQAVLALLAMQQLRITQQEALSEA